MCQHVSNISPKLLSASFASADCFCYKRIQIDARLNDLNRPAGSRAEIRYESTELLRGHWLALDKVARRTMSHRAMSCFATHFDVERVGQRLATILQQAHEPTIRATDTPASS